MSISIVKSSVLATQNEQMETRLVATHNIDEFDNIFAECVEQALYNLLGTKVQESVLDRLARDNRIAREDLASHTRELSLLLETNLGKGGITIERYILKQLYKYLDAEFQGTSYFDFGRQVERARGFWKNMV